MKIHSLHWNNINSSLIMRLRTTKTVHLDISNNILIIHTLQILRTQNIVDRQPIGRVQIQLSQPIPKLLIQGQDSKCTTVINSSEIYSTLRKSRQFFRGKVIRKYRIILVHKTTMVDRNVIHFCKDYQVVTVIVLESVPMLPLMMIFKIRKPN